MNIVNASLHVCTLPFQNRPAVMTRNRRDYEDSFFSRKPEKKKKKKKKQAIFGSDRGFVVVVFTHTRQKSIWPPNALGLMDNAADMLHGILYICMYVLSTNVRLIVALRA